MSTSTSQRRIHLGVVPYGVGGPGAYNLWLDEDIPTDASVNLDYFVQVAREAESAKFDLVFIVDSQFITPDSPPHYLNRLEPFTLLAALSVATTNLGLVGTATTSFNSPFNLVRRFASLDNISRGRAGWNVVTSGDPGAAGNFGLDEHYDYDTRYGRAEEYVDLARALWDSYEDDAFVRDRSTATFLDKSKLHPLDHKGRFFSVTGPLNLARSPQGQPVIFQAGDSAQGRDLGARIGEGIFTFSPSLEAGQAFYEDLKSRARSFGRPDDSVVIMPGITAVVGDTDREARDLAHHYAEHDHGFEHRLYDLSRSFGWYDFSKHDPDAPFPAEALDHAKKAFFTQAKAVTENALAHGLTLRQAVEERRSGGAWADLNPFVGSPGTIADRLQEWFEGRAADGFNLTYGHPSNFRRFATEVVPILQERGLFRSDYESSTLRGNLGLPVPENRHTVARSEARTDVEA